MSVGQYVGLEKPISQKIQILRGFIKQCTRSITPRTLRCRIFSLGAKPPHKEQRMSKLTQSFVRTVEKPGSYHDERGLILRINAKGTKNWILRYQLDKRRRDLALARFRRCLSKQRV